MRVSVIIPAYNEERFIGRCLRSITKQSIRDDEYEIIVINDASTDRTSYALDLFNDKVKRINNHENLGLAKSLNIGILKAAGEFVVRLDADDYVNSNYLTILSYFLEVNSDYDAVKCDYYKVDDRENILGKYDSTRHPIGCAIMFRKEILLKLGMFDDELRMNEEIDLEIRFKRNGYNMGHIALPMYRYRQHADNMTKNTSLKSYYDELIAIKREGIEK